LKDWRDLYAPLPTDSLLTALSTLPNGFRFATLDDAIARFTGPLAELRDNNRGLLEKLLPAIAPIGQRVLLELRGSIDSSAINGASADRLVNDGGGGNRPSPPPAGGVAPVPGPVAAAGVAGPPPAVAAAGFSETVSFLDPEQGIGNTCAAVATLIAAAWTGKGRIAAKAAQAFVAQGGLMTWPFHKGAQNEAVQFTGHLLPSAVDNKPAACRSTEANEVWPSYLEKAVVCYIKQPAGHDLTKDDYCTFTSKDSPALLPDDTRELPQIVLDAFFGGTSSKFIVAGRMSNVVAAMTPHLGVDGKTVVTPMLAETKSSRELNQDASLVAQTGLHTSHVYAVLGLVQGDDGTPQLIVRDPYGVYKTDRETIAQLTVPVPAGGNAAALATVLGIKKVPARMARLAFFALYAADAAAP
jgi:hypothetical protein